MKKILALTTLLVICFTSVCYAIDLTDKRWFRAFDDEIQGRQFIDLQTMEFPEDMKDQFGCNSNHRYVSTWMYFDEPKMKKKKYSYMMSLVHWDLDCKKMKVETTIMYNKKGAAIHTQNFANSPAERAVPGTVGEFLVSAVDALWNVFHEK